MQMVFPRGLLVPMASPENLWILQISVWQVPCSQALHQTSAEEEEKEKLLLGLVEKALQKVVGVGGKHSLRRNLPPLQVGEEVAAAALLPAGMGMLMESPPPSPSEHAGRHLQEAGAAMTLTCPQP